MHLRPYQQQIIDELQGNRTLIVAPTGAGKTAISSHIMAKFVGPVWFICHRNELVSQTVATLESMGLPCGVIKAGYERNSARIQVVGAQTMAARGMKPEAGTLCVIDEVHTTGFYRAVNALLLEHDGPIIGVTATPWRVKKTEGLADFFPDVVVGPTTGELIEMGFLVKPRVFAFKAISTEGVKIRAGEFASDELAPRVMSERSLTTIRDECIRIIGDRTAIVFGVNVEHAQALAAYLPQSEVVVGDTVDREAIYERLKSGACKFLCSVGVLTEGFDVPSIGAVVLARPTMSKALHVQMIGRGLRISEGKSDCLVLDFVENTRRHGLVHELTREEMKPDWCGEPGDAPVRTCPACYRVVPITEPVCECGYVWPEAGMSQKERRDLEGILVELGGKEAVEVFVKLYGREPPKSSRLWA